MTRDDYQHITFEAGRCKRLVALNFGIMLGVSYVENHMNLSYKRCIIYQ